MKRFFNNSWKIALAVAIVAVIIDRLPAAGGKPVEFFNPYPSPQIFIEGFFFADSRPVQPPPKGSISAVIIPHHLVAAKGMATGIKLLQPQAPSKILLIAPDHFNACPTRICTTEGVFHTAFGDILFDPAPASYLVTHYKKLFLREHAVHSILPFIANYLPDASVTPIVLSQKPDWIAHKEEVLQTIMPLFTPDTAAVISTDFSHYLPLAQADARDDQTRRAIESGADAITRLSMPDQSDCPVCVWLASELSLMRDPESKPTFIMHTNSARLLGDENIPKTTSHFVITYEGAAPE